MLLVVRSSGSTVVRPIINRKLIPGCLSSPLGVQELRGVPNRFLAESNPPIVCCWPEKLLQPTQNAIQPSHSLPLNCILVYFVE